MMRRWLILGLAALALIAVRPGPAGAHGGDEALQRSIGFEQRIGAWLPLDARFRDSDGHEVSLGQILAGKPMLLELAWYACDNLCPITLRNLATGVRDVPFEPGRDFSVVTVSIDPRETPRDGAEARARMLAAYGADPHAAAAGGWHALTGSQSAIRALADRVGFRYAYDAERQQYAHPAGVMVVDGEGRVSRYLFGLEYAGRDLKLGLIDASDGRLGSPIDQLVLRCHTFDPVTGQYTLAVLRVVDVAAGATVLVLGGFIGFWLIRERRQRRRRA